MNGQEQPIYDYTFFFEKQHQNKSTNEANKCSRHQEFKNIFMQHGPILKFVFKYSVVVHRKSSKIKL